MPCRAPGRVFECMADLYRQGPTCVRREPDEAVEEQRQIAWRHGRGSRVPVLGLLEGCTLRRFRASASTHGALVGWGA